MRPVYRGLVPSIPTITGNRESGAAYNYHAYGGSLLKTLGEYCSYCETALCGNAAIEHILAKSTAPQLEDTWDNLLLACVNCNSSKGSDVTSRNFQTFLWPCNVDYNTADLFRYEYSTLREKVVVYPALNRTADETAQAERTIFMARLNTSPAAGDDKARDRRVENRTAAWATATALANAYVDAGAPNHFDTPQARMLSEQIIDTAVSLGFWSVWMTVFERALRARGVSDAANRAIRTRMFCDTFPGTLWGAKRDAFARPLITYTGLPDPTVRRRR